MRGPQNIGFAEKAVIRPVLGCAWLCITDNVRSCSGNERWTCPSETHPSNRRIVNYMYKNSNHLTVPLRSAGQMLAV